MLRVAIGPELPVPSWNWVGFDLVRELSKYFQVEAFQNAIPECDVLIAVKNLPREIHAASTPKIIYLPIDRYPTRSAIELDAPFLSRCSAIGCHAEPLMPFFQPFCPNLFFIEHHTKYSLKVPSPFKERGFVLWVGAFENVPYLLKWLELHPLPARLVLLSNAHQPRSREVGFALAEQLQVKVNLTETHLNGHVIYPWSERMQHQLLLRAKAAIDIKGGPWLGEECWGQQMKPPTKGQKFVTSGLPFAMHRDSHAFRYFVKRGFELATPDDATRWFSRSYWEETRQFASRLAPELTLESVGLCVKAVVEFLVAP
jgi:hypothetical protein